MRTLDTQPAALSPHAKDPMPTSLELLLGPAAPGTPAHVRRLRSDDGIALHLISNARDDQLMLLSSPGSLPPDADLAWAQTLWHHTLEHPHRPGMRLSIALRPGSPRLHLMDVWPRHAVSPQALAQVLDEHSWRHRLWRESLEAAEDEENEGITDPALMLDDHIPPHRFA